MVSVGLKARPHGREGRAADDEEIGNVPALAITVHHRGSWGSSPIRVPPLVVRARGAHAGRGRAHTLVAPLAWAISSSLPNRKSMRACSFGRRQSIGHARRRQTPGVTQIRIEIDGLVGVGQVLGLRGLFPHSG